MANAETRELIRKLKAENARLKSRIETQQFKEMKLLDELIQLKGIPAEIKCRACGTRNKVR